MDDLTNYRPISVLSCLANLLEGRLLRSMIGFVERFGFLSYHQYGFVAKRRTQAPLESFGDCLHTSFDNNMLSCAVFLNVSKTFDSIDHEIPCSKPYKLGF